MYAYPDLNPAKFCRGTPDPRYPSVDGAIAIDGFRQPTMPSVPSVSAKLVDDPLAPTDSTFTSLPLHLTIRKRLGVTASPVASAAKVGTTWKAYVRPMPGPRSMETTTKDRTTRMRTLLIRSLELIALSSFFTQTESPARGLCSDMHFSDRTSGRAA